MSFKLLQEEVIDAGLCQGCGLCAGKCRHIVMEKTRPTLKDYCIMERDGLDCAKCYNSCVQVNQKKYKEKEPLQIHSLRSKDPKILEKAASGGVVTTLAMHVLNKKIVNHLVMVQDVDEKPLASTVDNAKAAIDKAGVIYGTNTW